MSIKTLTAGNTQLDIDLEHGGRIKQLTIDGMQLFVSSDFNQAQQPEKIIKPLVWGCYPMAPWVGRLRDRELHFNNNSYSFPSNLENHAIHGTCLNKSWQLEQPSENTSIELPKNQVRLRTSLGEHWPFSGFARQTITLNKSYVSLELSVHSNKEVFPASIGWHPWFNRQLSRGEPAVLAFNSQHKYACDSQQIPTGELIPQGEGPWDDCFKGSQQPPTITWPNALELSIHSDCEHWIIYNQPTHALCVEPVSAAANAINNADSAQLVTPDKPLIAKARFEWKLLT